MQIIDEHTICFKSIKKYFEKERDGSKKNTVRKLDAAEKRALNLWIEYLPTKPKIRIVLDNCDHFINVKTGFQRTLSDITEWQGVHIFSWR